MKKVTVKLTIYFEYPFWVGVFEKVEDNTLAICKVVFGSEPTNPEVYNFILKNYSKLEFTEKEEIEIKNKRINPKRMQREINKQNKKKGIETKSQLLIQKQLEKNKLERKVTKKQKKILKEQRKFDIKQKKRKQKHKGR